MIFYKEWICKQNANSNLTIDLILLTLAGLPKNENAKAENIHLIAASNKVAALEMSENIASDLIKLEEEGVVIYDAHLKQECLVISPVICFLCDNVRASELVNHMHGQFF